MVSCSGKIESFLCWRLLSHTALHCWASTEFYFPHWLLTNTAHFSVQIVFVSVTRHLHQIKRDPFTQFFSFCRKSHNNTFTTCFSSWIHIGNNNAQTAEIFFRNNLLPVGKRELVAVFNKNLKQDHSVAHTHTDTWKSHVSMDNSAL